MSRLPFTDACVLVTGASSGIGRALAVELARRRARLALVGRDAGRLAAAGRLCREAGAVQVETFVFDLTDTAGIEALVAEIERRLAPPLQLLVHAAGEVMVAPVEEYPIARAAALLDVNLMAGFALARALIPRMRTNGGTLGFISSGLAYRAVPFKWAYAASKAGLERLAEALRLELAGTPVAVRVAVPGAVDTPMISDPPTLGDVATLKHATRPKSPEQAAVAILAAFASRRPRTELMMRVRLIRLLAALGAQPFDWILRHGSRWRSASRPPR